MNNISIDALRQGADQSVAKWNASGKYQPFWLHSAYAAAVMQYLLDQWISQSEQKILCTSDYFGQKKIDEELLKKTALFLALVHDAGKNTPSFQALAAEFVPELIPDEMEVPDYSCFPDHAKVHHSSMSEAILLDCEIPEQIAALAGVHHGSARIPKKNLLKKMYPSYLGKPGSHWEKSQKEWVQTALNAAGISAKDLPELSLQSQVDLSALLVMADWIASNEYYFPLLEPGERIDQKQFDQNVEAALEKLSLPAKWQSYYWGMDKSDFEELFGFLPNPLQETVLDLLSSALDPGLLIIESEMGSGKTEAALAASQILAGRNSSGGICFGLPTKASANGIFPRVAKWAEKQQLGQPLSIQLLHGSADLNPLFAKMKRESRINEEDKSGEDALVVHDWLSGRKTGMLSDFVIGSVDQILMAALNQKYAMLRMFGVYNKVIVIDEVHAYDAYMDEYLFRVLEWLGAFHAPVILLSATLPEKTKRKMLQAYLKGKTGGSDDDFTIPPLKKGYPLITYTDGLEVLQEEIIEEKETRTVSVKLVEDPDEAEAVRKILKDSLQNGGCAGIVLNTVQEAQNLYEQLKDDSTYRVILFHSRFTARRRAKLEEEVVARTGKLSRKKERDRTVIIGTQVIEQSLDLDFDLLITDLCPMDLLLQRIGRMHRHGLHDPIRPESLKNPVCYVLAPDGRWDKGTGKIYNHWILKQTLEALPEKIEISRDIPVLVESVYGISDSSLEHEEYLSQQEKSRRKANAYRMAAPVASRRKKTVKTYFTNMLENDEEGKKAVRDSAFSTEVILVRKNENGEYFLLSDTEQKNPILSYNEPDSFQIRGLLLDKVSLPSWVFATEALGFINELEKIRDTEFFVWKDTGALKGELFIPLDENGQAQTEKFKISYNDETGLHVYKKGSEMDGQGI